MSTGNDQKAKLLGMPFGTATSRLRKSLLFQMAQQLGRDICYRCGAKIAVLEEFSIEHKKAWASASCPVTAFFDLGNIEFSHLSCNSGAGYRTRVYADDKERYREGFKRFYSDPDNRAKFLERKRERYRVSTSGI